MVRADAASVIAAPLQHGVRENWRQFALLVAINAFVGGMIGLERSILPLLATEEFGLASTTAVLSFIASFGLAKALTNLAAGQLSARMGRRRLLIIGWLIGLPVPVIIILAPSWGWVVAANALLGLNQGLCWSMTVNMKIDLAGPAQRGLALGLNESAGYLGVGIMALASGLVAREYGLRPEPFFIGIVLAAAGLALSVLFVRDTTGFLGMESHQAAGPPSASPSLRRSFADATWRRPRLVALSQAGFVNNLNDGLAWGIFPLFFASQGLSLDRIATLAALYPLVWGAMQVFTGWASDLLGRNTLIVSGMLLQGLTLALAGLVSSFGWWVVCLALLGLGTALVYPTLLAATGDAVHPSDRATTLGVYRFWRDSGALAGAVLGGVLADLFSFRAAIEVVAVLTLASGLVAATLPHSRTKESAR